MRKEFKISSEYKERNERIEAFLKENPEYEYKAYLNAMELYIEVKNGHKIVLDHEKYKELIESQNLNCKKNNHCTKVQELEEILKRKARSHEDLYVFSKKDIVKIAIVMFDCCLKTGYNFVNELVYKNVIIEAPMEEQAIYNRKHRKQGQRRINVYCLKEDLNNKKNKLSYSQIKEEIPIKLEKAIV